MPESFDDLPRAITVAPRKHLPQLVWLVPLIALLLGGWLIVNTLGQRGPTITISFLTAEGIEPDKTRLRYKNVDIGEVKAVRLSEDRSRVLVTAQLAAHAEGFRADDSRFWVVRPRISGGKVSGIGTLLSGAYIGADLGTSYAHRKEFIGLETPPILTKGMPGRHYTLEADEIGSLDIGSPVYYRRVQVGEVVAHEMNPDGTRIVIKIFVRAPYDRHVKPRARFWNASGMDFSLDASGVKLQTQSLVSIVVGGIAFESPEEDASLAEAAADSRFTLHPNRATALKAPDGEPLLLTVNFKHSVRGLQPGAPVDFRGIVVGEVLSTAAEFDESRDWFDFPVGIALYTERIVLRGKRPEQHAPERIRAGLLRAINQRGLRAQLRSGNLLTGQMYVALDFFPEAAPVKVDWRAAHKEFPAVRGDFAELQLALTRLLGKLERLPIEEIGADLRATLKSADGALQSLDRMAQRASGELAPELVAGLKDLRATLVAAEKLMAQDAPLQLDLRETLREVGRAAQALRTLADTLERQPEALLRGKRAEEAQ